MVPCYRQRTNLETSNLPKVTHDSRDSNIGNLVPEPTFWSIPEFAYLVSEDYRLDWGRGKGSVSKTCRGLLQDAEIPLGVARGGI